MRKLSLGLILLCCSSIAVAQGISVHGLGHNTCGEAMQQISRTGPTTETAYTDWLGGFITGYNAAISDTRKIDSRVGVGLSFDTLTAIFKNKCGQDATKLVIQAAKEIYQELGKRQ